MSGASRLVGKVAVVTGAGKGIGRAIAERFVNEGATVVVSSRTKEDLDPVVDLARELGLDGRSVVADATDPEDARSPVRTAVSDFGRIDVLVNNVGGSKGLCRDPFTAEDSEFEISITLNLMSTWWASREALPHMREQRWGRIINIGSGASKNATGFVAYTAAKHGLVGLTKELASKSGRYGITVNCLCPGWTQTRAINWETIGKQQGVSAEEARTRAEAQNVQHRILMPEELTGMAAFLASEEGKGITGQIVSVDGGYKI